MARLARLYVPGLPQHLILDARPGQLAFRDNDDLRCFADTLRATVRETGLAVHAYAWLANAAHLLVSPRDAQSIARTVQAVGRRYVAVHNRRHGREGPLWDGRYRATVLDPDRYLLFVSRVIESLAGDDTDGVRRSSHRHHVGLGIDPLITDHALYWALGNTPFERQRVYRELSEQPMDALAAANVIDAARKGWVLGDDAFRARCAQQSNRRIEPLPRGRPKKAQRAPD
jgi:putative transposase